MFESTEELRRESDELRRRVTQLGSEARRAYYADEAKLIKDPDTYAVLNYFFVFGLHHFYLGKFFTGLICLILYIIGMISFLVGGWIIILLLALFDLPQLFFSQRIVHRYNNKIARRLVEKYEA